MFLFYFANVVNTEQIILANRSQNIDLLYYVFLPDRVSVPLTVQSTTNTIGLLGRLHQR